MRHYLLKLNVLMAAAVIIGLSACGDTKEGETFHETVDLPTVSIQLTGEVAADKAEAVIVPSKEAARVIYAIGSPADRDNFIAGNMVGARQTEGSEEFTAEFTNLVPGQVYTVFAKAVDSQGRSGGIASASLVTNQDGGVGFQVNLQYASDKAAGITMTTDLINYYAFRYHLGTEADRQAVLDQTVGTARVEMAGCTVNFNDLTPSTNYMFYVLVTDRQGEEELIELPVTTTAAGSCPEVTFSTGGDAIYMEMKLEPNQNTGKTLIAVAETWRDLRGIIYNEGNTYRGNIFHALETFDAMGIRIVAHVASVNSGTLETHVLNYTVEPGESYDIYALSYDKQGNPGNVQIFSYTVPELPGLAAPSLTAVQTVNTMQKVEFEVTPSPNTIAFYFGIVNNPWYDPPYTSQIIMDYFGYGLDLYYCGPDSDTVTVVDTDMEAAEPGDSPYLFIIPLNANGKAGMGDLFELQFTLPNS